MSPDFFDMVVKLAASGAFGICIFAILWTGWLMKGTKEEAINTHRSLRNFMIMCVIIAIIAAITGVINSFHNARQIEELSSQLNTIRSERNEKNAELIKIKSKLAGLLDGKSKLVELLQNDPNIKEKLVRIDSDLKKLADEE